MKMVNNFYIKLLMMKLQEKILIQKLKNQVFVLCGMGSALFSKEIISDSKKFLIGNRWMSKDDIPNMTLEEGVLFAEEMLKESCKKMESCAEPIRFLVIRPEGLAWVKE